jgi:hypothetical protein
VRSLSNHVDDIATGAGLLPDAIARLQKLDINALPSCAAPRNDLRLVLRPGRRANSSAA